MYVRMIMVVPTILQASNIKSNSSCSIFYLYEYSQTFNYYSIVKVFDRGGFGAKLAIHQNSPFNGFQ